MDLELAREIYGPIQASRLADLREMLLGVAVRYARVRADWALADAEGRRAMERDRTVTHDSLIASCDVLARNMAKAGEDASWRRALGDDRKRIGDFACCLHCLLGLAAR